MMTRESLRALLFCLLLTGLSLPVLPDPCGMVPPISLDGDGDRVIERVGKQKTYVFRKGDLQTVVIHPGFRGNVDQFGMLIPFPEAPALRKMPDNTFEQLENAIVPPTIPFWVRRPRPKGRVYRSSGGSGMTLKPAAAPARDRVVVLKEEAVGMYEVAVLEAGSAAALKRWMSEHSYRFPDGMESTCEDYVEDGWCFVAVKTRVGRKAGVDPRPGMRRADPQKPKDSTFSGKVQAMGFRFRSETFEVPMRLSAFNGGDFHNIIYVVADQPVRASNLPKSFVVKQVSGEKLYSNVTEMLPYKLLGGTEDDMSPNQWKQLNRQRDPKPHNGVAAQLFAHDLLAGQREDLTHSFEEREKLLLDIGETLDLRGTRVDRLNASVLETDREEARVQAIGQLKTMTFTLIEGDFPVDILARENIKFERFELPSVGGIQKFHSSEASQLDLLEIDRGGLPLSGFVLLLLSTGLGGGYMFRKRSARVALLFLMAVLCLPLAIQAKVQYLTTQDLIQQLDDPEESKEARESIRGKGKGAVPFLLKHLQDPAASVVERGYCLTLLTERPDPEVSRALAQLAKNSDQDLVKLWTRAALLQMAETPGEVLRTFSQGSPLEDPDTKLGAWKPNEFPELQRPVALKLQNWQLETEESLQLLALSQAMGTPAGVSPTISQVVGPILRKASTNELTRLMFSSQHQQVRRLAAGLLANSARTEKEKVLSAVGEALSLSADSQDVPWAGGALFIPQFRGLSKTQSVELIGQLVRWSVWTEIHETPGDQVKPLENNLRSYNLWSVAGGRNAGWRQAKGGRAWLSAYAKIAGNEAARQILTEQRVSQSSDLWSVVKR